MNLVGFPTVGLGSHCLPIVMICLSALLQLAVYLVNSRLDCVPNVSDNLLLNTQWNSGPRFFLTDKKVFCPSDQLATFFLLHKLSQVARPNVHFLDALPPKRRKINLATGALSKDSGIITSHYIRLEVPWLLIYSLPPRA